MSPATRCWPQPVWSSWAVWPWPFRAVFGGFAAEDLILGFVLVGCSIILLCAWERLAWEPLAQRLDELS
jgi:hypothetical protein